MDGKKYICLIKQDQATHTILKSIIMLIKKNIKLGKINILLIIFLSIFVIDNLFAESVYQSEKIAELSVLDKVSSKNINIKIQIGEEFSFQNLSIKVLKCYNSEL